MQEFNLIGSMLNGSPAKESNNGFEWYKSALASMNTPTQMYRLAQIDQERFDNVVLTLADKSTEAYEVQISDQERVAYAIMADYQQLVENNKHNTSTTTNSAGESTSENGHESSTSGEFTQTRGDIIQYYKLSLTETSTDGTPIPRGKPTIGTVKGNTFIPNPGAHGIAYIRFDVIPAAPQYLKDNSATFTSRITITPSQQLNRGQFTAFMATIKEQMQVLSQWSGAYKNTTGEPWAKASYYAPIAASVDAILAQANEIYTIFNEIERTAMASTPTDRMEAYAQFQRVKDFFRNRKVDPVTDARQFIDVNMPKVTAAIGKIRETVQQAEGTWDKVMKPMFAAGNDTKNYAFIDKVDAAFQKMTLALANQSSPTSPTTPTGGAPSNPYGAGGGAGGGGGLHLNRTQVVNTPSGQAVPVSVLNNMGIPVTVAKKQQNFVANKKNTAAPKEWDLSFLKLD